MPVLAFKKKFMPVALAGVVVLASLFLAFVLPRALRLGTPNDHFNDANNASPFTVTLGQEQYVAGPLTYLDAPFFTMPTATGLRAFSSNAVSFAFSGSGLDTLNLPSPDAPSSQIVLSPGAQGSFDDCGAWLVSAYEITSTHWIGWYHAEHACDYAEGITHKSMAFAESFDGGRTWQKTGYPDNQVITPDAQYAGNPLLDRAGDAKIIQQGDYFYMIYIGGDYKTYLARSLVTDEGKPGTWFKYYHGAYTQPGIGGHQTPINAAPGGFTFNTYLNAYLNLSMSAKYGFYLKISAGTDITRWTNFGGGNGKSIYPLVTYQDDPLQDVWSNRTPLSGQVYGYPSFIALDGNSSSTGSVFYIYYMKVYNGGTFDQRYLLRRQVTLHLQSSPAVYAQVALTRYQNSSTERLLVSTETPNHFEGYNAEAVIGALLPYAQPGFHPLYECYLPAYADYLVTDANLAQFDWRNCGSSGTVIIRNIGWVSTTQTAEASLAIYRCFDGVLFNHFISTDPHCEGKTAEWRLGYIFPPASG
jgi:hypothetical protein